MRWAVIFIVLLAPVGWMASPLCAADHGRIPPGVALVINKAEQLMAAEKIKKSIELLETFQAKRSTVSPEKAESRGYTHYLVDFLLGNGYLALDDPAMAVKHYQVVVQKKPDFTEARFNLARGLYDQNRPAAAGREFVAAYDASGGKTEEALYYGAVCFMRAKDYPLALATFKRLVDNHPQSLTLDWRQSLARLYLVMEKPDLALPQVKILAEQLQGKQQRQWRETLIYVYLELGMKDRALAGAAGYTRDDPLEPKWWKIHAWLLLEGQDYRRALTSFTAYSYLQTLSDEERELMGDINMVTGIPAEAVRYYENQINLKPDPGLFKKTARGFLRLYDDQQALKWIERGLEVAPEDQDLLTMKGYLLYEAERLDEADAVYRKLAALSPKSGEHWLMRGYIAWRQRKIDAAVDAFEQAAEYDRYAEQAQKALEHLQ